MAVGDVVEKRLAGPVVITTSNAIVMAVAANHRYVVKQIILCNTNSAAAWVTLSIGTTVTVANALFYQLSIAALDTLVLDSAMVLEDADDLYGISGTGFINITVTGWDNQIA